MSSRMRETKGHTNNRRAHYKVKAPRLSKCSNCGAYHLRHRMCPECGHYRGKMVLDVVAKQEAKMKKLQASEEKNAKEEAPAEADTEQIKDKAEGKEDSK